MTWLDTLRDNHAFEWLSFLLGCFFPPMWPCFEYFPTSNLMFCYFVLFNSSGTHLKVFYLFDTFPDFMTWAHRRYFEVIFQKSSTVSKTPAVNERGINMLCICDECWQFCLCITTTPKSQTRLFGFLLLEFYNSYRSNIIMQGNMLYFFSPGNDFLASKKNIHSPYNI